MAGIYFPGGTIFELLDGLYVDKLFKIPKTDKN